MATLNREAILKADDLKRESVDVMEWGGSVLVKQLTASERDRFESKLFVGDGINRKVNQENLRAKLCALCIVGDDGKRLFTDEDVTALGNKSAGALNRVFEVAQRINGMGAEAVEEAKKLSEGDTPAALRIA